MADDNDGVIVSPEGTDEDAGAVQTNASLGELLLRNRVVSVAQLEDARDTSRR